MRVYRTKTEGTTVVEKVFCNSCGKEIPQIQEGIWEDYFHGEKTWGYFSMQDGQKDAFDLCETCYKKWVNTFHIST